MSFNIPIPTSPFIDSKTGRITRDWYLFLLSLFQFAASGSTGTTTQVLHGGGAGYSQVNVTSDITGVMLGLNGGTGISNVGKTATLGGNLNLGGAFNTTPTNTVTMATTGATNITLPTSGTLITAVNLSGDVFATGTNTGTAVATITSGAITNSKLSTGAVDTGKITAGAITVTQISNAAVTNAKLANMPPSTLKGNNTVTGAPLDLTVAQALSLLGAVAHVKTGSITHDISITGSQAITGLGFTPKALAFFASGASSAFSFSVGMDDGTTPTAQTSYAANSFADAGSFSIYLIVTNGVTYATAKIASLDSDGFTLTWAKTGLPTGTAAISYLAIG